jgi:hypothetical protein
MSDSQQSLPNSSSTAPEQTLSWRQLYLNAQHEKGIEGITKAVAAAEIAIFVRSQQLRDSLGHTEERNQLNEASKELLRLKTEKLGWPNPSAQRSD